MARAILEPWPGRVGSGGPTVQRSNVFWLSVLLGFGVLLWLLSSILLPFVLGMAIAYFVDPLVDRLERRGISRALASSGIIVGFFLVGGLFLLFLVPALVSQVSGLIQRLPDLVAWARDSVIPLVNGLLPRLGLSRVPSLADTSAELMQRVASVLAGFASGLLTQGLAVVNVFVLLAITPLAAFYLLRDWPKVVAEIDGWLPVEHAETIRTQVRKVDGVLAGFARGSATVCLVQGAFYAIALTLVGLDFGLVIGLTAGAISFVPYLGAGFGFFASVGVALYQFWPDWTRVAVVAGVFFAGQGLQDYVLVPRLVGDQVGLHPLWVIFGVLAGGSLFGFVGMLLAVPACAVIGVLVRFAISQYKESPFYLGDDVS